MNDAQPADHERRAVARLLGPDPRVALAVVLAWWVRAVIGWIGALPVIASVAASGSLSGPNGDRVLFAPESLWLAELVRRDGSLLLASLRAAVVLCALGAIVRTLTTLGLFLTAIEPRPWESLGAAMLRLAPRWLALGAIEFALRGGLAIALAIGVGVLGEWSWSANEALLAVPVLVLLLGAAAISAAIGVAGDALRALIVHDEGAVHWRRRLWSLRRLPTAARFRLYAAYIAFAGAGTLCIAIVARASEVVDVSRAGGWRLPLVFALHQATLLALTWLQLKWIRRTCAELADA